MKSLSLTFLLNELGRIKLYVEQHDMFPPLPTKTIY